MFGNISPPAPSLLSAGKVFQQKNKTPKNPCFLFVFFVLFCAGQSHQEGIIKSLILPELTFLSLEGDRSTPPHPGVLRAGGAAACLGVSLD